MTNGPERRTGGNLALILAAERLFAERGVAGVSLREVNQAANQKNISAAHYHFGSREGLIDAVLEYRLPSLDARRGRLLRRDVPTKDLRFYLTAFVDPLIDELSPRPGGNYYVRFMQQHERFVGSYDLVERLTPDATEIYRAIDRLIGYLPEPVRHLRIRYLINIIHGVLASAEAHLMAGDMDYAAIPLTAVNLVDMTVAALAAPLSPGSLDVLERQAQESGSQPAGRRGWLDRAD